MKALDIISRHEARLKRIHSATLKDLRTLHAASTARRQASLEQAKLLRRADLLKGRPTNFKAIGFDFAIGEIDTAIARENALREAKMVLSAKFSRSA